MKKAKISISKDFTLGRTDDRLFGSFAEHMGATIYNGIFEPDHPEADQHGFRKDVTALVKELNLSAIRYPGGNFVSGFNWEDSVGPVSQRPVRLDLAWQAIEPNTFGLNEFMKWLSQVQADPIMAVNLGTRGPDAARNLVEYCNIGKGSYYSDLRRQHGVKKPYKIKTWCLGNEMDGPWQIGAKTASEYGRVATEAGKVMKWVDPEIELVAVGSSTSRMTTYPEWDKTVLEHTYDIADYIALHHYVDRRSDFRALDELSYQTQDQDKTWLKTADYLSRTIHVERQISSLIAACDYVKALKRHSKTMNLAFDEWNVIAARKHPGTENEKWEIGSPIDCGMHTMEDVLAFASMMMAILRRADRIKIACQSLLINTGPLIIARDGQAWRNAIYYPFKLISLYGRGMVLQQAVKSPVYSGSEFSDIPVLDSLTVFDEEKETLTVFIVNRGNQPLSLFIDLRDFSMLKNSDTLLMQHDNLDAANTMENPQQVVPRKVKTTHLNDGQAETTIPAYAFQVVRLTK